MPAAIPHAKHPTAAQPSSPTTNDAPNPDSQDPIITLDNNRIRVLPGASDTAASFEIEEEDHTLGNALRFMIMKNPEVELCGYSIPHPSEAKMNLRIQTYDGTSVYDVLEKGLEDLMGLCDVVTEKFTEARDAFDEEQKDRMEET